MHPLEKVVPKSVWQSPDQQEYLLVVWRDGTEETFKLIHSEPSQNKEAEFPIYDEDEKNQGGE